MLWCVKIIDRETGKFEEFYTKADISDTAKGNVVSNIRNKGGYISPLAIIKAEKVPEFNPKFYNRQIRRIRKNLNG